MFYRISCCRAAFVGAVALLGSACATTTPPGSLAPQRVAAADSAIRIAIANESALSSQAVGSSAIAVIPLAAPAGDTLLGALAFGLSELVAIDLAEAKALTVVDRLRLDALLRELALAKSGRVDSASAPRVGRLLGAGRVIVGTLSTMGPGDYAIDARIADVSTGRVAAGIDARTAAGRVFEAEKSLVFRLLDQLGVVPTPRERERIAQRRTDDLQALLAFSRGVEARVLGDLTKARASFQEAAQRAPLFEAARSSLREIAVNATGGANDPLARVTRATSSAVNPSGPSRVGEAADAPFQTLRQSVEFLLTIRVP